MPCTIFNEINVTPLPYVFLKFEFLSIFVSELLSLSLLQDSTCLYLPLEEMLDREHGSTVSTSLPPQPHAYHSGTSCMDKV